MKIIIEENHTTITIELKDSIRPYEIKNALMTALALGGYEDGVIESVFAINTEKHDTNKSTT